MSGSFAMRSSTGSMPSAIASSSMPHSSPNVPTDSPGARMNVLASMSIAVVSTSSFIASAAYA